MADAISYTWTGVKEFDAALARMAVKADAACAEIVSKGALIVEAAAKQHMNGRPGPNVVTGTLRRSVKTVGPTRIGPGAWRAEVGPAAVYGRRIELGFHGVDSLGRVYAQPAYPFLRPGLEDAGPALAALYRQVWTAALT